MHYILTFFGWGRLWPLSAPLIPTLVSMHLRRFRYLHLPHFVFIFTRSFQKKSSENRFVLCESLKIGRSPVLSPPPSTHDPGLPFRIFFKKGCHSENDPLALCSAVIGRVWERERRPNEAFGKEGTHGRAHTLLRGWSRLTNKRVNDSESWCVPKITGRTR